MRTILGVMIALSSIIFLSGCTSLNGSGFCNTQYGCKKTMTCATGPNCQCTDPGCYSGCGNFCLSTKKCCRAFGNQGAMNY